MKKPTAVAGALIVALGVAGVFAAETKQPARVALPKVTIERGEKCVEPTGDMRRNHMSYILHQRDETMHRGIRTTWHSLKNCVNCHASRQTGSVIGRDGFCASCHEYAAVRIDCFECHTPLRQQQAAATP